MKDSLLILRKRDVISLLEDCEREIIDCIDRAYCLHDSGESRLPQSSFLRFPEMERERIIALPAYLGGNVNKAGIKWISSFPENVEKGLERASAAIILNSMETGQPQCLLEGSVISAVRTAASAALAAKTLYLRGDVPTLGLVGCGYINKNILQFIMHVFPQIERVLVFDLDIDRGRSLKDGVVNKYSNVCCEQVEVFEDLLKECSMVSFATTAISPYVGNVNNLQEDVLFLNVSLRDFKPEFVLQANNVVDDIGHVCRENTSIDLAVKSKNGNWRPELTLADFLQGRCNTDILKDRLTLFSPFGLGVLDVALSAYVYEQALGLKKGHYIHGFNEY